MTDDKKVKGKADRSRINMSEDYEVQYWSEKFGVSKQQLEKAVKEVVNNAKDVEGTFKKAMSKSK